MALFSGGLDSILACRVIADQGIRVIGLKFVTPFFDYELLDRRQEYTRAMQQQYSIEVEVIDLSEPYLRMLAQPAHGFGKHFNPCIDCKILMLVRARELLESYGASFLITGEVLGQRPMSQRRDTLQVIERDSGCTGLLLRPLSAGLLPPTLAEQNGLVDRDRLYTFSGRGRREQHELAAKLGITGYPAPAGGCMLTDPNLAPRIRKYIKDRDSESNEAQAVEDIRLLVTGRQFRLQEDIWFVIGRDERENNQLEAMRQPEDWLLRMTRRPGPLGLVRQGEKLLADAAREEEILPLLAGIIIRYGKKIEGKLPEAEVTIDKGSKTLTRRFAPLTDDEILNP
nr:thiamine biosynthesis protein [Desulfobulbus alkaliphilus]